MTRHSLILGIFVGQGKGHPLGIWVPVMYTGCGTSATLPISGPWVCHPSRRWTRWSQTDTTSTACLFLLSTELVWHSARYSITIRDFFCLSPTSNHVIILSKMLSVSSAIPTLWQQEGPDTAVGQGKVSPVASTFSYILAWTAKSNVPSFLYWDSTRALWYIPGKMKFRYEYILLPKISEILT